MIIKQRPAFRKLFNQRGIPRKDEATAFILQQGQMVKIKVSDLARFMSVRVTIEANVAQRVFGSWAVKHVTLSPDADL